MKEKNSNRLLTTLCVVNTAALVSIGLGMNGVKPLDLMSYLGLTDKSTPIDVMADEVIEGKIVKSYADPEECSVVTIVEIESAMQQVGEITTVAYDYSGIAVESDCAEFIVWEVGFTRNRIEVEYEGTIRAGYVIDDIHFELDQENKTITVTLPEVQVFSNEITDQEIEWDDNFFNHIDPDIAADLIDEAKEEELDEAIDNGLYQDAEANAQETIRGVITNLCDYEVVFDNNQAITQNRA